VRDPPPSTVPTNVPVKSRDRPARCLAPVAGQPHPRRVPRRRRGPMPSRPTGLAARTPRRIGAAVARRSSRRSRCCIGVSRTA